MIYDKIENINTYMGINPNLDIAIGIILDGAWQNLPEGRQELKGNDLYCNNVQIQTKTESIWERHEKYLDIQIVKKGDEIIRYTEWNEIQEWSDYDEKSDCATAPYCTKGIDMQMMPGWFMILFPQDAHMPGIRGSAQVSEKTIFKVRIPGI